MRQCYCHFKIHGDVLEALLPKTLSSIDIVDQDHILELGRYNANHNIYLFDKPHLFNGTRIVRLLLEHEWNVCELLLEERNNTHEEESFETMARFRGLRLVSTWHVDVVGLAVAATLLSLALSIVWIPAAVRRFQQDVQTRY
ncbi:hypothetical protein SCUCBS95973_002374 [Sporothrix curviconia]|uniref:Receptor L-domain domain-containing protein n=1 Tax=Sporothrix curviconia TaxID=1260050 RepID=A0ABP0B6I5_9PEZI